MSQNPMLSLCAQNQLARTVICQLPSSSAQSRPDLSPGSQVPPQADTNGSSRNGKRPTPTPSVAKFQVVSLSSGLAGEGVIEHPRWPQELGKVMCGGPRAISISSRNLSGTVHLPKQGHIHKSSSAPALGWEAISLGPHWLYLPSPEAQIGSYGCFD